MIGHDVGSARGGVLDLADRLVATQVHWRVLWMAEIERTEGGTGMEVKYESGEDTPGRQ